MQQYYKKVHVRNQRAYLSVLIVSLLSTLLALGSSSVISSNFLLCLYLFLCLLRACCLSSILDNLEDDCRVFFGYCWKTISSSNSSPCLDFFSWTWFSFSNPMFEKSIRVLAELMAYLYFLAITSILRDWPMLQATSRISSLISSKTASEMREIKKRMLQQQTITKSSLFHMVLWRYFLKPCILTLKPKSTETVKLRINSIIINMGDSATLKPSIIVVMMRMQQVIKSPM